MVLNGMVWYGMVWYSMAWYGIVNWYGVESLCGMIWTGIEYLNHLTTSGNK